MMHSVEESVKAKIEIIGIPLPAPASGLVIKYILSGREIIIWNLCQTKKMCSIFKGNQKYADQFLD